MKRGKKLIVLFAVFVVLLGAALLVAKLNPEKDENAADQKYGNVILSLDPEKVTNFSWDYSDEAAFTKTAEGWTYDADQAFPVNESQLEEMLRILSSVGASKTIENVEDLDQYGLEYPFCAIKVTADGKTYALAIGDQNNISGDRYFTVGDGNVYMVSNDIASYFNFGPEGAMLLEEIPDMTGLTGLKLESPENNYDILYEVDSDKTYSSRYKWFMDGQVMDTELTEDLVVLLKTLEWSSCVDYNATDLAPYGLDTPAVLTATYGSKTFVLELGDQVEKGTYARIADSKMVYLIKTSVAATLQKATYGELMPDEVLAMAWETVDAMDITLGGKTYTLESEEIPDPNGCATGTFAWKMDGKEVGVNGITGALEKMPTDGYATGLTPTQEEEIRFKFYRSEGHHNEVELVLYRHDDTNCLVTLDGVPTVLAKRTGLVLLLDAVNEVIGQS